MLEILILNMNAKTVGQYLYLRRSAILESESSMIGGYLVLPCTVLAFLSFPVFGAIRAWILSIVRDRG